MRALVRVTKKNPPLFAMTYGIRRLERCSAAVHEENKKETAIQLSTSVVRAAAGKRLHRGQPRPVWSGGRAPPVARGRAGRVLEKVTALSQRPPCQDAY